MPSAARTSILLALVLSACVREGKPLVVDLPTRKGDLIVFLRVGAETAEPEIKAVGHAIVQGDELAQAITTVENDALMLFVVHADHFERDGGAISGGADHSPSAPRHDSGVLSGRTSSRSQA